MATAIANVPHVDDRIESIVKRLRESGNESEKQFPGLANVLDAYLKNSNNDPLKDTVDREKLFRGLLRVFFESQVHNAVYRGVLGTYSHDEQRRLKEFVEEKKPAQEAGKDYYVSASPGAREEMRNMHSADKLDAHAVVERSIQQVLDDEPVKKPSVLGHIRDKLHDIVEYFKSEDSKAFEHAPFENWGRTVENKPLYTFVPKTVEEIRKIVFFAEKKNLSVRVSGYRHSWSPSFGSNGQILISVLDLHRVERLPDTTSLGWHKNSGKDLQSIVFAPDGPGGPLHGGKRLVEVGCAVTNEAFRRWCNANDVTLPLNVIMVEITLGGSNAPICHGAGRGNQTLSDLVRRIHYVDAHGELQKIDESSPTFLKAASGCFGLLGVITHITFEVDRMSYAEMRPCKIPTAIAIPPPDEYMDKIPGVLAEPWRKLSAEEKRKAQAEFEDRASNHYYAEWFWFPFSDNLWVNTWNKTADQQNVSHYPTGPRIFVQFVETVLMNILQNSEVINKLVELTHLQQPATTLISRAAMQDLPDVQKDGKPIKSYLPDALHFQRAIQNVRVRDIEVEIPLQAKATDPAKVDYCVVQKAWWDAIMTVYEPHNAKACPMRMPLEMRIMGGSNVIMAPQKGNDLGTCSIEVLTLQNCKDIWPKFAQEVLDKWMAYDASNGGTVKIRPHWAKEWYGDFKVNGRPWIEKLKNSDYKIEIAEFKEVLAQIGKQHAWTLNDLEKRFSNALFDELIFSKS